MKAKMLIAVAAAVFFAAQAHADTVLFSDPLQTSSDLAPFVPVIGATYPAGGYTGSAFIGGPILGSNGLSFGLTTYQGDIVTNSSFSSPSGMYSLTFDYLGLCFTQGCGAAIAAAPSQNITNGWVATDDPGYVDGIYGTLPVLPDAFAWQTATIDFSSSVPVYIALEDYEFAGASGQASIWYRNIVLSSVPEPGTLSLLGLGLVGLGFATRRKLA
jgi:hypothetical protein